MLYNLITNFYVSIYSGPFTNKKNKNIFLFWAVVFYRCGHVCLFFLAPSLSSPKLSRGRSLNISQLLQPLDHVVHYVSFLTPTKKEINEINHTCRFLWIKITLATRKNLGGGGSEYPNHYYHYCESSLKGYVICIYVYFKTLYVFKNICKILFVKIL